MKKEININKGDECDTIYLIRNLMMGMEKLDLFERVKFESDKLSDDWLGQDTKAVSKKTFKVKFSVEIIEE